MQCHLGIQENAQTQPQERLGREFVSKIESDHDIAALDPQPRKRWNMQNMHVAQNVQADCTCRFLGYGQLSVLSAPGTASSLVRSLEF